MNKTDRNMRIRNSLRRKSVVTVLLRHICNRHIRSFSFSRSFRGISFFWVIVLVLKCFDSFALNGCFPDKISAGSFAAESGYRQYLDVYEYFVRSYMDVIVYINNGGDSVGANDLLNEYRSLAKSSRWNADKIIVGYVPGQVSRMALDNLRSCVGRLARKFLMVKEQDQRVHKVSRQRSSSKKDTVADDSLSRFLLKSGFLWEFVMDTEKRNWENRKGQKIDAVWYHISQDGSIIWLFDDAKSNYFSMKVENLSNKDREYVSTSIARLKKAGLIWRFGVYADIDTEKEICHKIRACQLVKDKSIPGVWDLRVYQPYGYGGLCDYGKMNGSFK